jgi:hypothetical protein
MAYCLSTPQRLRLHVLPRSSASSSPSSLLHTAVNALMKKKMMINNEQVSDNGEEHILHQVQFRNLP